MMWGLLTSVLGKQPLLARRPLMKEQRGVLVPELGMGPAPFLVGGPLLANRHLMRERPETLAPELGLELVLLLQGPLLARRHAARKRALSSFLAIPAHPLSPASCLGSPVVTLPLAASDFSVEAEEM